MTLLNKLWKDDRGAVISTELILVLGIAVFGLIPGLVILRDSINKAFASFGPPLASVAQSAADVAKQAQSQEQTQVQSQSQVASSSSRSAVNLVVNVSYPVRNDTPPSP